MATDHRKVERVVFQKGFDAHVMAIDGTWRRACILKDVSGPTETSITLNDKCSDSDFCPFQRPF
jgi:hypothetical protein